MYVCMYVCPLTDEIICIWINVDPDPLYGLPAFKPMAEYFGIWHEHKRGSHNGNVPSLLSHNKFKPLPLKAWSLYHV